MARPMTNKPETMLKAAYIAKPGPWHWFIPDKRMTSAIVVNAKPETRISCPVRVIRTEVREDGLPIDHYECFDPINNDSDQLALIKGLAKLQITIHWTDGKPLGESGWYFVKRITKHETHSQFPVSAEYAEALLTAVEAVQL